MCLMIFYYIVVRMTLLGLNSIWTAVFISHIAAAAASILLQTLVKAKMRRVCCVGRMRFPKNIMPV